MESELERLLAELQWSRRKFARMLFEEEWDELIDPVPGEKDEEFERFYATYRKRVTRGSRRPEVIEKEVRLVFEFANDLGIQLDRVVRKPLSSGLLDQEFAQALEGLCEDIRLRN
ncbi:hypothetical protein [Marinobacter sp.]